ncbi:MAG: hypothetical protein ABEI11_03655 [Haloarculaceae archaeon]
MRSASDADGDARGTDPSMPADEAVAATEAYEVDDGVVLYDARAPLAWVQSTRAHTLDEMR